MDMMTSVMLLGTIIDSVMGMMFEMFDISQQKILFVLIYLKDRMPFCPDAKDMSKITYKMS